ncbi:MAG: hypothetical protein L0G87_03950 [Renibacterium salmoninarum]|nr:hypothetical protein [Renibacterium salmoninarum]
MNQGFFAKRFFGADGSVEGAEPAGHSARDAKPVLAQAFGSDTAKILSSVFAARTSLREAAAFAQSVAATYQNISMVMPQPPINFVSGTALSSPKATTTCATR